MKKIKNGPAVDVPEDRFLFVTCNIPHFWRFSGRLSLADIDTAVTFYLAGSTVKQGQGYSLDTTTITRLLTNAKARSSRPLTQSNIVLRESKLVLAAQVSQFATGVGYCRVGTWVGQT